MTLGVFQINFHYKVITDTNSIWEQNQAGLAIAKSFKTLVPEVPILFVIDFLIIVTIAKEVPDIGSFIPFEVNQRPWPASGRGRHQQKEGELDYLATIMVGCCIFRPVVTKNNI